MSGWTVEGDPDPVAGDVEAIPAPEQVEDPAADADLAERPEISNAMLVLIGVFGGLYLLYTWGWLVVAKAYSTVNALTAAGSGTLGGALQQVVFWAAPFAPILWFVTALVLCRGGRAGRLAVMLVVGAAVLVPLPMLIARGA